MGISLARFEGAFRCWRILDVPPPPQRNRGDAGPGGLAQRQTAVCRLHKMAARSRCASLCSRSIGVLQEGRIAAFPGKIRLLVWASLIWSAWPWADGGKLWRHPEDLGSGGRLAGGSPSWLPLRWFGRTVRKPLEPAPPRGRSDFSCGWRQDQPPWMLFMPWGEAAEPLTWLVGCGSGRLGCSPLCTFSDCAEPRGECWQNRTEKEGAANDAVGSKSG